MDILIDARLLIRRNISGIGEYTRHLLQSLFALDRYNSYTIFYNNFRKQTFELKVLNSRLSIINWCIPNKILNLTFRFLHWPKIDKWIKTDLIFSPHFDILAVEKIPRILTFHDLSFLHHPDFFSYKQRLWHWLQNYKYQIQKADKIITNSNFTKSDLINTLNVPEEKIRVIYPGLSREFRPIPQSEIPSVIRRLGERTKFLIPDFFILYLGTLEPRKNLIALVKAFNILKTFSIFKNLKLILAGQRGWLYGNIFKEASFSAFREDIIFLGPVSYFDKIKLYNLAQVFIYHSFFEGFGFPPLEAQACGCPVIASDRTSLSEILGKSALLVNPWKIGELAEGIKKLIIDQSLRNYFIKSGLENAKRFSWPVTAQKILNLFNQYE